MMKWTFDRLAAFAGLLLLGWLLLVVAICIRAKMPGPVFFRQRRVGLGGRLFTMVKFRTMTLNHGGSSVSVAGESRITPLGARLRRWKLDELPELWNVLVGDMSFVGPDPTCLAMPTHSQASSATYCSCDRASPVRPA